MTVAFDAITTSGEAGLLGGGDITFAHTPSGTPRGILYYCIQRIGTDQINTVTYGGTAMTEVADSPLLGDAGVNPMRLHCFFLGASVPTGVQNCVVNVSNNSGKRHYLISLTAAADTSVDATGTFDGAAVSNPSVSVTTTAGVNTWISGICDFWNADAATIAPDASFTQRGENDMGPLIASCIQRTSNGTGGVFTVDWTTTVSGDATAFASAIREAGGGGTPDMLDPMGRMGFFGA